MNLARPYSGVAATVDGDVLVALAGTSRPSSGRHVARLVRRGSQAAVNGALDRLVRQGLVHREPAPPAFLYSLNRDHVGYAAVVALADMRAELLGRLRRRLSAWEVPAAHVSMFGSAARADGGTDSDIDLVVIRPRGTEEEEERWREQVAALDEAVLAWTGNDASIVELAETELPRLAAERPPVLDAWRQDAVELAGRPLEALLGGGS